MILCLVFFFFKSIITFIVSKTQVTNDEDQKKSENAQPYIAKSDLVTGESAVKCEIYEKKIDALMVEIKDLKNKLNK